MFLFLSIQFHTSLLLLNRRPSRSALFPYTTLFRSGERRRIREEELAERRRRAREEAAAERARQEQAELAAGQPEASPRGGPAPAAGPAGPAGSAGSAGAADPGGRPARRRSLKERGGIVGMIRRRLGRG